MSIWGNAGKAEMPRTHGQIAAFLYLWCGYPSDLAKDDASKGVDICIVDEMLWSLLLPDSLGRVIYFWRFPGK